MCASTDSSRFARRSVGERYSVLVSSIADRQSDDYANAIICTANLHPSETYSGGMEEGAEEREEEREATLGLAHARPR